MLNITDAPPMIVSRYGNQSVECPTWLLEQLQQERQHTDAGTARLLTKADYVINNADKVIDVWA